MIGDWVTIPHAFPMQIVGIDEVSAYATWEGNNEVPWIFGDKDDQPQPIPLTYEILKKNGWKDVEFWCEYQDGNISIQACLPDMRGRINGIEIEYFQCKYVHQYQHLLRLYGLDELADNLKV